ncbi:flagellar motor switch protein FliM [Sagittula salina]|uniref:Flagellar motor switch protein FliM n=1 Tax=Sagittula salina TaxID=2820268 RepID=A0A940MT69_9RHOB|nr:FliM/FliN family flagellar motor switch protein [Sagittula salina]MBP0484597.1 FliM/FliN family flagellar motor switch protein [Sagittula salina]
MTGQDTLTPDTRAVEEMIVERAKLSYVRLPMLEVVFDRFALALTQTLKGYLGAMVDVQLKSIDYTSCQDAMEDLPEPSLIAVTAAEQWGGTIAAVMRSELLFNVVEITFGGRSASGSKHKPRSFTAIEKRVGEGFVVAVLHELSAAFDKVAPTAFTVSHIESNPRALLLAPPSSACVRAILTVEIEDREAEMCFALPNTAFEKVIGALSQQFTGGQLGGDSGWRSRMTQLLELTNVPVTAVMGEAAVTLRQVLGWAPGQVLDLGLRADDPVTLTCAGQTIARAEVGRRANGHLALKLSEKFHGPEEQSDVHAD